MTGTATSNTLTFPVSSPNVAVVKSTTSTAAAVGDTVSYSILVTNSGIAPVSNIQFSDPIPAGATFNTGSVTVNGESYLMLIRQVGYHLLHWDLGHPRQ